MKAVVMAGGEGTRLRPLTVNTPKPLVPVCNIPVMEHMIKHLKSHNITDIIITLHYLADEIVSYFGNGNDFGVSIHYSVEEEPLGTAGSIKKIASSLDGPFLIVSGDALADFDFTKFIEFHKSKKAAASILLKKVENPLEFGLVIVDRDSHIKQFIEKPTWGEVFADTANTGIYLINPEVLDLMEYGQVYDFSRDIFPEMMSKQMPLCGCILNGYWCDIGNLEQYKQASYDLFNGLVNAEIPGKKLKKYINIGDNSYIHPSVEIGEHVVIGKNCKIKEGVKIKSYTCIGDNCIISSDTEIERSIIWSNTYIGKHCTIYGTIVGKGVVLKEKVRTNDCAIIGDRCFIASGTTVNANVKIWPDKKIEAGSTLSMSLIWGGRWLGSIFGKDGISGLSNIEITPEFALKLGSAFGACFEKESVINTSRDDHPASRMINRAIICGLISAGINVNDLRVIPAALSRHVTRNTPTLGGIHVRMKPYDPNSVFIELFNEQGINISKNNERKIENLFSREDFRRCSSGEIGKIEFPPRIIEMYSNDFLESLDIEKIAKSEFKVVIDYGFSSSSAVFPNILGKLGCETVSINSYIDPSKEGFYTKKSQLSQLSKVVVTLGANAGVYLDSDSESFFLIDEKGRLVNGNQLLTLVTLFVSKVHDRPSLVVTSSAPAIIDKIIWNVGGEVIRTKSDRQSLMESALSNKDVVFAGNHRGGFIFPKFNCGFDSMFAIAKILEFMAKTGLSIAEVADSIPPLYMEKADVECAFADKGRIMSYFYSYCDTHPFSTVEGIKVFFANSWGQVVPDRNEPILHLTAEADTEQKAKSIIEHLKHNIKSYKSEEARGKISNLKGKISNLMGRSELAHSYQEQDSDMQEISHEHRFYFWIPGEYTGISVYNIKDFAEIIFKIPEESLKYHFIRGDFENWLKFEFNMNEAVEILKEAREDGISSVDDIRRIILKAVK